MKKILQVCPRYYPELGGVEYHVQNISERLAQRYDVTVFTTVYPTRKFPKEETINGVKIKRFNCFDKTYFFSAGILNQLRRTEFDVVHAHDYHSLTSLSCRFSKREKLIVTTRYHGAGRVSSSDFLLKMYKPIGRTLLEEADIIICLSRFEEKLLRASFRIDEEKVIVIPNGIDTREFNIKGKKGKNKQNREILCVARLEKYKGIHYVIEALPKLDNDITLTVVGKGPYEKNLLKLVEKKDLAGRTRFYKNLPRNELLKRYHEADLFILLSKYEAFGNAVAEALASKIPCIVADNSALQEWVDNANCFGISYPIDIDGLANMVETVIGREVEGIKMWDWDNVVERLQQLYEL